LDLRGKATLTYGVGDAIANMRIVDAIFLSAGSGHWVNV
jgi:hypothetical protein